METSINQANVSTSSERARNVAVRLPQGLFESSCTVALVEGRSLGEVLRTALGGYIETVSQDEDFRERAVAAVALHQQQVDALVAITRNDGE